MSQEQTVQDSSGIIFLATENRGAQRPFCKTQRCEVLPRGFMHAPPKSGWPKFRSACISGVYKICYFSRLCGRDMSARVHGFTSTGKAQV